MKPTAATYKALAVANGYKRGEHREQDESRDQHKHGDKTKRDHDSALRRYVL